MDRTDHFHLASSVMTSLFPGEATLLRDKRPSTTDVSDCAPAPHPLEFDSRHGPFSRSTVAGTSTAQAAALALIFDARRLSGAVAGGHGPRHKAEGHGAAVADHRRGRIACCLGGGDACCLGGAGRSPGS